MSYYPEHVYYQSTQHDPLAPLAAVPNVVRRCSVKGCSKLLPDAYALKMCDACRGRHRIYANTKRAKRKQEKAAVGAAQPIRACDPLIRSFFCLQRRPTPSLPPTAHASVSALAPPPLTPPSSTPEVSIHAGLFVRPVRTYRDSVRRPYRDPRTAATPTRSEGY